MFCRVRPLVDGGLSKHIQLPSSDNKVITLAKTEEVRIVLNTFFVCLKTIVADIICSFTDYETKSVFLLSVSHREEC